MKSTVETQRNDMCDNRIEEEKKGFSCPTCGSEVTFDHILGEQNRQFLQGKCNEGKLDEIMTIARMVNEQLPQLTVSSNTMDIATSVTSILEGRMETSINTLGTLCSTLLQLPEKLPEQLRMELANVVTMLEKMQDKNSRQSENLLQMINELVHKPSSKGRVAESTLSQAWGLTYTDDLIVPKGGPGKTDLLVTTMVKDVITKISVERKTGIQKYTRQHVLDAIRHAKDEGVKYAMVVYDSYQENLSDTIGPLSINPIEDGVMVALTDSNNNGWKIARYALCAIEYSIMNHQKLEQIDVTKIGDIVKETAKITEQIDQLRKKNNSAILACDGVRGVVNMLEQTFGKYIEKLRYELGEIV